MFRQINLRDENRRVPNQRGISSSPIVYRDLTKDFQKIFRIFSSDVFCFILTKLGSEGYFISFPKIFQQLFNNSSRTSNSWQLYNKALIYQLFIPSEYFGIWISLSVNKSMVMDGHNSESDLNK